MTQPLFVTCPHCGGCVEILEINCRIFRHGVYKHSGKQIHPHLNRAECEQLVRKDKIFGCGKPFRLCADNQSTTVCSYDE